MKILDFSKTSATPANAAINKLEQLKNIKDRGLISEQEFDAKKKEILIGL